MKFSQIKELRELVGNDWRDACEKIKDGKTDFTLNPYRQGNQREWRFIHKDQIDATLVEDLECDEYVLGCFNAWFLADVTGWPLALIEAAQKGEAYEALGQAIIQEGYVKKLAEKYASADGYGHHFSSYDGEEHEIGDYYIFKN